MYKLTVLALIGLAIAGTTVCRTISDFERDYGFEHTVIKITDQKLSHDGVHNDYTVVLSAGDSYGFPISRNLNTILPNSPRTAPAYQVTNSNTDFNCNQLKLTKTSLHRIAGG